MRLETFAQIAGECAQGGFVAPVPHPLAKFLRFYQSGSSQNRHMMRDRGLGKVNAQFDVGGAQTDIFADRTGSPLFERLQNSAAGGVGDGVQRTIQCLLGISHGE